MHGEVADEFSYISIYQLYQHVNTSQKKHGEEPEENHCISMSNSVCLTLVLMTGSFGDGQPIIRRIAGTTKRLQVTNADTGLPGSPKHNFDLAVHSCCNVANVVGFL